MFTSQMKAALAASTLLLGVGSAQSCPATPSVTIEISPVAIMYGSSTITSYTTLTVTNTVLGPQVTPASSSAPLVDETTGVASGVSSTPAQIQPSSSAIVAPSLSSNSAVPSQTGSGLAGNPSSSLSVSEPTPTSAVASSSGIPARYTTETMHDGTVATTYTIPPSGTNMGTVIIEQPTVIIQQIFTETVFYSGSEITSYTIFGSSGTETIMVELPSSYESSPTSAAGIPFSTALTTSSIPALGSSSALLSSLQSTSQGASLSGSQVFSSQLTSASTSSSASSSAAVSGPAVSLSSNALTTSQIVPTALSTSQALVSTSVPSSQSASVSSAPTSSQNSASSSAIVSVVPVLSSTLTSAQGSSSSSSATNSRNLLITLTTSEQEFSSSVSSAASTTSSAVQSSISSGSESSTLAQSSSSSSSSDLSSSSSSPVSLGYVTETIFWTGSVETVYTIPPSNGNFGTVVVEEPSVTPVSSVVVSNYPSIGTSLPLSSSLTAIYQNTTSTSTTYVWSASVPSSVSIGTSLSWSTSSNTVLSASSVWSTSAPSVPSVGTSLPWASSSTSLFPNTTVSFVTPLWSSSVQSSPSSGTGLPWTSSSTGIFQNETTTSTTSLLSTSAPNFPSVGTGLPWTSASTGVYQNETVTSSWSSAPSTEFLGYVTETIFYSGSVATSYTIPPSNGQFGTIVVEEPSTTPSPTFPSVGTSLPLSSSSAVYLNTTIISSQGISSTSLVLPSSTLLGTGIPAQTSIIGTAPFGSSPISSASVPVFSNTTSIAQLPSSTILSTQLNTSTTFFVPLSTSSLFPAPVFNSTSIVPLQWNTTTALFMPTSTVQPSSAHSNSTTTVRPSSVSGRPVSTSSQTGIWNSTIVSSSTMAETVSMMPLNGTAGTSSASQQSSSSATGNSNSAVTTTSQPSSETSLASVGSVIAYVTETGYYSGNATFTTTLAPAHSGDTETVVIVEPIETTTISQVYSGNQTLTTTLPLNEANPAVQTVVVEVPAVYITSYEGYNGTRTLTQVLSSANATTVEVIIETPTAGYVTETIFYTGSAEITGDLAVTVSPNGPTSGTVFIEVPANYVTQTSYASIPSPTTVTESPSSIGETGTVIVELPITWAATATFLTTTEVYPGYGPMQTTQYPQGQNNEGLVIRYTGTSSAASLSPTTSISVVTGASSAYTSTYTTGTTTVTEYGCPTPPSSCGSPGLEYAVYQNPYSVDHVSMYESLFDVDYFKTVAPNATGYTQFVHLDSSSGGPDTVYGLNYNFPNDQYTVAHRGWFYACETGFYDISFHYTDDINFLWIYDNAYSGFKNTTSALEQEYDNNPSPETIRVYLNSGDYMPMRVMYGNGGGGALSIFSILGPDGLEKGGCGTPDYEPTNSPFYVSNLSTECDASAKVYSDYGSET